MPVGTALARRGQLPVEMLTIGSPDGSPDIGAEIAGRLQNRDELRQPVLLVGPKVHDPLPLASPTLVVCTDRSQETGPALPVVEAWHRTFGGGRPRVAERRPTTGWPTDPRRSGDRPTTGRGGRRRTRRARHRHRHHVLHGGDTARYLLELAEQVDDAVIAVTSDRWPGGHSHWYSTTRRLVQRSPGPVLVIPTDLPGY